MLDFYVLVVILNVPFKINDFCDFFSHRDQINQHLDTVQGDLEALKEFLRGSDDYQVDANTLLSVSIEWILHDSNSAKNCNFFYLIPTPIVWSLILINAVEMQFFFLLYSVPVYTNHSLLNHFRSANRIKDDTHEL